MIPAERILIDGDTAWMLIPNDPDRDDYVAHTRLLDRPCDTCGGTLPPFFECHRHCLDGRHTFDLGVAWRTEMFGRFIESMCSYRVSVVPGMVLPIDDSPDRNDEYIMTNEGHTDPAKALIYYPAGWWQTPNGEGYVTLPSAAAAGMYAVKLRVQQ